jgi:hypothetical protein
MARLSLRARASLLAALLAGVPNGAWAEDDVRAVRIPATQQSYVVLAWNDLGMHCLNPRYDADVILPPYNTLWAQVVQRGNPPKLLTSDLSVEYRVVDNTYSYGKRQYGQFWDFSVPLLGIQLAPNTGVNLVDPAVHNGLSGVMLAKGDHFEADGIPVVPVNDAGTWNPYQVAEITVKTSSGQVLAKTRATIPTSDEIRCDKCHGRRVRPYLELHDKKVGTRLQQQSNPFLCASCHGSPALRAPGQTGVSYLSRAMHGFHAKLAKAPGCYDCHPGQTTQCSRSLAHTDSAGACTKCHGGLAQVASSIDAGRVPWASEPKCATCHTSVAGVDTGNVLYRDARGHGGVSCAGCHGSPHAMVPSRVASDNAQAVQYQTTVASIGSCGACHTSSRGEGSREFLEKHGGLRAEQVTACNVCHTAVVSADTGKWPHSFQWRSR